MALSTILGYPRIGPHRELKTATEAYWRAEISERDLIETGANMRSYNRAIQKAAKVDLLPCNDFSFYDHVLDMSALLGVVPARYGWAGGRVDLDTTFAMARGAQHSGVDVPAAEMTKWFDTNYHYIVPEFEKNQTFKLSSDKPTKSFIEARDAGVEARPVLVGPISYLLLGKDYNGGHPLDHLENVLPIYAELMKTLEGVGAAWIQFDEPFLVTDLDERTRHAYQKAYTFLRQKTNLKLFLTAPYGALGDNLPLATSLPIDALHIDLVHGGTAQLNAVLEALPSSCILSAGIVDGRNIWRNDLRHSLDLLDYIVSKIGKDRLWIAPSCSLLHVPYDLQFETKMDPSLREWMAFAKQKCEEIALLARAINEGREAIASLLSVCHQTFENKKRSPLIHDPAVTERLKKQPLSSAGRATPFTTRRLAQSAKLRLPLFPTTTIGSFPQTAEVRKTRAAFRAGKLSQEAYDTFIREQIAQCVTFQENVGLDVLVHGEFERNDMVEFFGEKLRGFVFTENGWVQSYGSRGVKPPIIFGDVTRPAPMTVTEAVYAQSLTQKPMKGMLTGPVTILQWSFVRDDQPRSVTAHQIALALQDEVLDLERAGLPIIQIDEPAFREGLPLRQSDWEAYFTWAVQAFRLSCTGVRDETQIHTHMCYSDFNHILASIRDLDADVLSIETSRSQMELLEAFTAYRYPQEIGPGVYDIHSPRIPPEDEILMLLEKACQKLEPWQIWVNPDCGLKTRDWPETRLALARMVMAAKTMRERHHEEVR